MGEKVLVVSRNFGRFSRGKGTIVMSISKGGVACEATITANRVRMKRTVVRTIGRNSIGGKSILKMTHMTKVVKIGEASRLVPVYRPLPVRGYSMSCRLSRVGKVVHTFYAIGARNGANIRVRTLAKIRIALLAVCSVYGTVSGRVMVSGVRLIRGANNGDKSFRF